MATPARQYDSIARLMHLEALASSRHHILLEITGRIRTARNDLVRARHRLETVQAASFRGLGDDEIARVKDRIAELEATVARLVEREGAAEFEWNTAARTRSRALERARELKLPIPLEIEA